MSRPSAAPTCAWCAIRFTVPAATTWPTLLRDMGVEVVEIHNAEDPTLCPGCIPSPFSPGSMKASRKWASWATMPCSSNDGDAGPHCRWRLARQLRERPPHHHAAYQAHGRPRARTGRVVSHGDGVGYARPHVPQAGAGARQYARRLQVDLRRDGKGRRP